MTPERWQRVEELYHAALTRGESDRPAFLARACAGDEALRREVETLLAQPPSALAFLDDPAVAMAARLVSDTGVSVLSGRRLGAYQVHEPIGAGGMGEVYRARDVKLGRDVAIKILPRPFTSDPERLARFQREARLLAALNHPHIGAIYGLEESDGIPALVLELVEGPTLADRLAKGRIPLTEALAIARQIADALEAAHQKGIIHRDLKPANIKITPDGMVKVLDFGLAKAAAGNGSAPDLSQPPTVTVGGTRDGLILGTAAYMSPEQARGQAVDKRTDIWAFGCVLFEMLSGRAAFAEDTIADTIAAILEREPNWNALPASAGPKVRDLVRRCLQKDPKRRLRDIGDARIELEERLPDEVWSGASPAGLLRRGYLAWTVYGIAALTILLLVGLAVERWPRRVTTTPNASEHTDTALRVVSRSGDTITLIQLDPAPASALKRGSKVTITATVKYALASADSGTIALVLQPNNNVRFLGPQPMINVRKGSGTVTLSDTITIPAEGVSTISVFMPLTPAGSASTNVVAGESYAVN